MRRRIPVILLLIMTVVLPAYLYKRYDDRSKASVGEVVLTPVFTPPSQPLGRLFLVKVRDSLVETKFGKYAIDVEADTAGNLVVATNIVLGIRGDVEINRVEDYEGKLLGWGTNEFGALHFGIGGVHRTDYGSSNKLARVYFTPRRYPGVVYFKFSCDPGQVRDTDMLIFSGNGGIFDILNCNVLTSLTVDYAAKITLDKCSSSGECQMCGRSCGRLNPEVMCPMIYVENSRCLCEAGFCTNFTSGDGAGLMTPMPPPPSLPPCPVVALPADRNCTLVDTGIPETSCAGFKYKLVCITPTTTPVVEAPPLELPPGACKVCGEGMPGKRFGNAHMPDGRCDSAINLVDYTIWSGEYFKEDGTAGVARSTPSNSWRADFNCDGKVTLSDYSWWAETLSQQR